MVQRATLPLLFKNDQADLFPSSSEFQNRRLFYPTVIEQLRRYHRIVYFGTFIIRTSIDEEPFIVTKDTYLYFAVCAANLVPRFVGCFQSTCTGDCFLTYTVAV